MAGGEHSILNRGQNKIGIGRRDTTEQSVKLAGGTQRTKGSEIHKLKDTRREPPTRIMILETTFNSRVGGPAGILIGPAGAQRIHSDNRRLTHWNAEPQMAHRISNVIPLSIYCRKK